MKTRERILVSALRLYNQEGESNITALDIANVLDISPGNLYYHFKGKGHILAALVHQFRSETDQAFDVRQISKLNEQEAWILFYIVFQSAYSWRFLYRNTNALLQKYPNIANELRHSFRRIHSALRALCDIFATDSVLLKAGVSRTQVASSIALALIAWPEYQLFLRSGDADRDSFVTSGVSQVASILAPYMSDNQRKFALRCHATQLAKQPPKTKTTGK